MAFYVVRGGRNAGIYENWHDAVNAGWFQRQPYGNAVKVESVEDAEAFLAITRECNCLCFLCDCPHTVISTHTHSYNSLSKAFAQGAAGQVKSWVSRQHFVVQFTIFSVTSSITAWFLLELLQWYEGYLECADDIQRKLGPMCMNLNNLQLYVAANVNTLITFAFYEISVSITVLFAWLSGLLG